MGARQRARGTTSLDNMLHRLTLSRMSVKSVATVALGSLSVMYVCAALYVCMYVCVALCNPVILYVQRQDIYVC